MTTTRYTADNPELDAFYADIAAHDLQPLWEMRGLLTKTPTVATVPHRWSSGELSKLAERSGELVPIDRGGDRRVLALSNPGLDGAPFISATLWAAVQFLQPGELAPAHRHSPAALRFVLDGDGVYTVLDGDPVTMSRGDLVLTPAWSFHEHHNPGSKPMMWLDVLDLPIVAGLDAVFFEEGPSEVADQSVAPRSRSERLYGQGPGLAPVGGDITEHASPHSPLVVYRWADTDAALSAMLELTDTGHAQLRFRDPTRDRDVMPTLRCEMRRLLAGASTPTDRQTGSRVCAVLNGSGRVDIGEASFTLAAGDIFVVPSWATHRVHADRDLDIFTTSDAPVLDALSLYRSEQVNPS
ncbi:cupin domain-containing protein [Rhodococcus sp. NCIMB 12038]|uniref:cupin domain-containing protein n=1 Tax=Rhodococcus sp. NCIMB 12038 TaxID=933800 RepID=UPI000B3BE4A4|nr:cupin domain-containing protein [Rhodococcus sp. NCIMB 12038]OUS94388.1 gentisate 1,2-dioxygenase [Rhodococcus sp. NCIMB 12038]